MTFHHADGTSTEVYGDVDRSQLVRFNAGPLSLDIPPGRRFIYRERVFRTPPSDEETRFLILALEPGDVWIISHHDDWGADVLTRPPAYMEAERGHD